MIISGGQGEGKTTFVKQLAHLLSGAGVPCTGFYAEGFWNQGVRTGFDLVEIGGERKLCLCNLEAKTDDIPFRRFYFKREALAAGYEILAASVGAGKVVFVDEVGALELEGKGWADAITELLKNPPLVLMLSVRQANIKGVLERFNIQPLYTWFVLETKPEEAIADLVSSQPGIILKM